MTETEIIKAHDPSQPQVARSAWVFLLSTTTATLDDCNGHLTEVVGYAIYMLMFGDTGRWLFSSDRLNYGSRQQDDGSRAQRDADFASYFAPGRLVHGFPGQPSSPTMTADDSYRMRVTAPDSRRPLRFSAQLEQLVKPDFGADPGAVSQYRPAPNTRVEVAALRLSGNEQRLASYFQTEQCLNCQTSDAQGRSVQTLADPSQPIVLSSDIDGHVAIEFFLDFGALTQAGALRPGGRISVPVLFAARASVGSLPERTVAQEQVSANLDAIGVVEAITYEPPTQVHRLTLRPLPRPAEAPLSSYVDDPGATDGPRTLVKEERVILQRLGSAGIGASGATPGRSLVTDDFLQVTDRITVNACGLVADRSQDGLPAGEPGRIWVKVRFFDGLRGKFGVNGSVCRAALTIGSSGDASGFGSSARRFVYWAAENRVEAVVSWAYAPYKVIAGAREAMGWISWGLGYEAVYVVLQSAVAVEFDADGRMQLTTREGDPAVVTSQTDPEGVSVPVRMTASIGEDLRPELMETDADRAAQADAWLASLDAPPAADSVDVEGAPIEPSQPLESDQPYELAGSDASGLDGAWPEWTSSIAIGLGVLFMLLWMLRGRQRKRTKQPIKQPTVRTCPACGSVLGPKARFCGACGVPLPGRPKSH
ncbi:MAG: zinc ribbon domain-containing protein [Ardenticatenales bacterium]|nr:zinc ribbon domain-containing protein [Ardenticatenales bacterium]